ncbi:menaquinone-dependent protoporphyrinogen IX dehydrogenase [Photobacterium damselae]|uniref:menaquinone-dependent protoporphyrinogen IX dehydrogenase n=1 Tax=Photobacterium damselae TaxID=38293 RepID=UPI000D074216|nr:menaquinone-dependent protoporphyrinogen IX dehydrogenase [Photobacterium damselae]PSB90782.1 menaquinone-dependent protoporphyrinogen IX dehydrogenase [Photobacterium damselae subsp. damselae]
MKKKLLMLYSSREGQTLKILHYIEKELGDGFQCEVRDLHAQPNVNWPEYDQIIIGASIRYGHFNKLLYQFIERNQVELKRAGASFICVNLTARKEGKDTPQGSAYVRKFLQKSPWQPEQIAVFAGALRYPRYRWFDRLMIQLIMKITGGETDTTKEVEYTNWQKVSEFASGIAAKKG